MICVQEKEIDSHMLIYKYMNHEAEEDKECEQAFFEELMIECINEIIDNREFYDNLNDYISIDGEKYSNLIQEMKLTSNQIQDFIVYAGDEFIHLKDATKLNLDINNLNRISLFYDEDIIYVGNGNGKTYVYDRAYDDVIEDMIENDECDFLYFFMRVLASVPKYSDMDNVIQLVDYK